jgi:hypothetical protein
MSRKFNFERFKNTDIGMINGWFKNDKMGMKFLSSYVTDDFSSLIDFKKRYLWIVYDEDVEIGFF